MAEGIFNTLAEQRGLNARALSCGLSAYGARPASEYAIEAAKKYGADISNHRSRQASDLLMGVADAVYCMTKAHEKALKDAFPGYAGKISTLSQEDISDPFMGDEQTYERTAAQIYGAVERLIERHPEWK